MSDWFAFVNAGIQVTLALVGVWYGVETRKARLHGQAQLELLRKQATGDQFPFLTPAVHVVKWDDGKKQLLSANAQVYFPIPTRDSFSGPPTKVEYVVQVFNQTKNLAQKIRCIIYDGEKHKFLTSPRSKEFIAGDSSSFFYFGKDLSSKQEIAEHLESRYKDYDADFNKAIVTGDECYVLITYLDMDGTPYWIRRTMVKDNDGSIVHHVLTSSRFAS
jgi:hypothetical protein